MRFYPPKTTTIIREANTPESGELIYDIDTQKLYIGDGTTPGGFEVGQGITTGTFNIPFTILSGETKNIDINPFPTAGICYKATTTTDMRVRLYYNSTYRTADASRESGTAIIGDHGMYFEFLLTSSNSYTRILAPPAIFHSEGTGYFSITDLSGSNQSPTLSLTLSQLK